MNPILYVKMKKRVSVKDGQLIRLKDICDLLSSEEDLDSLRELPIERVTSTAGNYLIIDVVKLFQLIAKQNPLLDLRCLGPTQTIVEVKKNDRLPKWLFVGFVWLILFIGSGLTIMNFHTDVSMKQVHQRIYYLVTGKQEKKPLALQIPYSLGIGAGMILFFNHVLKKRISDEPSPMDLEVYQYQETIDQYLIDSERKKNHESHST